MLAPGDEELIARDPDLPGLATLLDPAAFARVLREAAPDLVLDFARPTYTRYKARTNCLVAYQVGSADGLLRVHAKAYSSSAVPKLRRAPSSSEAGALARGREIAIPGLQLVILIFPADGKLPALERIESPAELQRMLEKAVADRPDLWSARLEVLRYKPERRLVGRLSTASGAEAAMRFYTEEDFAAASTAAKKFSSREMLLIPSRLGGWKRRSVLIVEWLQGIPLRPSRHAEETGVDAFRRTGEALSRLHTQRASRLPRATAKSEARSVRESLESAALLRPGLTARLQSLGDDIARALALSFENSSSLHGDFYDDQVLLAGDQVAILDFDRARTGDPRSDLGNLIAHLERDAKSGVISPAFARAASESFTAGYEEATQSKTSSLEVYQAAGLAKLCAEPFRERLVNWPERLEELVDAAESSIASPRDRVTRGPPSPAPEVTIEDEPGASKDAFRGFAESLDPEIIAPLLTRALEARHPRASQLELRRARVLRYKPARRGLVEYELDNGVEGPGQAIALLGKIRAKGLDQRAYRATQALWNSGWSDTASDAIGVPEPIAEIPELHMWLQRRVEGRTSTALLEHTEGSRLGFRIADALHKLHHSGVAPERPPHSLADEIRILREALDDAGEREPPWRDRLSRVQAACESLATTIETSEPVTLHRDFYPDQVLIAGHSVCLLDLDLYCEGDASLDAGNFTAHAIEQSLRRFGHPEALASFSNAFRERFLQLSGEHRRPAVAAYETLSLARHIFISLRIRERQSAALSMLEFCESRLGLAEPPAH